MACYWICVQGCFHRQGQADSRVFARNEGGKIRAMATVTGRRDHRANRGWRRSRPQRILNGGGMEWLLGVGGWNVRFRTVIIRASSTGLAVRAKDLCGTARTFQNVECRLSFGGEVADTVEGAMGPLEINIMTAGEPVGAGGPSGGADAGRDWGAEKSMATAWGIKKKKIRVRVTGVGAETVFHIEPDFRRTKRGRLFSGPIRENSAPGRYVTLKVADRGRNSTQGWELPAGPRVATRNTFRRRSLHAKKRNSKSPGKTQLSAENFASRWRILELHPKHCLATTTFQVNRVATTPPLSGEA